MSLRRGAIMLELMVSLAIFVMAGLSIGGAMRQGLASVTRSREDGRAADLARSTLARIEAGMESSLSLNGPVKPWLAQNDVWEGDSLADDERSEALAIDELDLPDSGWELEIVTEPSEFPGLSKVTVRAFRLDPDNSELELASATLVQLMASEADAADIAGEVSDFGEAANQGAEEERRREPDRGRTPDRGRP